MVLEAVLLDLFLIYGHKNSSSLAAIDSFWYFSLKNFKVLTSNTIATTFMGSTLVMFSLMWTIAQTCALIQPSHFSSDFVYTARGVLWGPTGC